jgi:dTDP-4-amino-4,6-dideoxygalactose transaminase
MHRGLVDKYSWVDTGSSFYPTELQAAFLLAQLEALDRNMAEREALFWRYRERLGELEPECGFRLPVLPPNSEPNFHCVFLFCESESENDSLRDHLREQGIQAFVHYVPLHDSKMGRSLGYHTGDLPVTENLADRLLRLPIHNDMRLEDVDHVCESVASFYCKVTA